MWAYSEESLKLTCLCTSGYAKALASLGLMHVCVQDTIYEVAANAKVPRESKRSLGSGFGTLSRIQRKRPSMWYSGNPPQRHN